MIDLGLKELMEILKMEEHEVPSDEHLRIQAAEQIICMELCMLRDHGDDFVLLIRNGGIPCSICFLERCKRKNNFFIFNSRYGYFSFLAFVILL